MKKQPWDWLGWLLTWLTILGGSWAARSLTQDDSEDEIVHIYHDGKEVS